jgi:hypothetical protein
MQPPPETIIPADSTPQDGTFDTQFKAGFAGDDSLQVTFHLTSFRLTSFRRWRVASVLPSRLLQLFIFV